MPKDCYLRFPSLHGDLVSFVADDDVWLTSSGGGIARRLTSDHAPCSFTRLSPDGSLVAYTSRRDGPPEAYVIGTSNGTVRRVSFFGDATTRVIGWRDSETVLAISSAGQPFRQRTWCWALDAEGDRPPERLPLGPITGYAPGPGGSLVLGVNQSRARGASWKRYRGGTASSLWIDPTGAGRFEPLLTHLGGQLEDPTFVGGRLVFVSDHEGVGNLYSVEADGGDLRRHSDHDSFYARSAAGDGSRVVYQCAGQLLVLGDLARDSQPVPLEVELSAPRSGRSRRMLRAADELAGFDPDHDGRASAVEVRGTVHWLTHRDGPARYLGGGDGVRARLACVVGSGASQLVCFVTDADGEDSIEVVPASGPADSARRIRGELGRVLEVAGAPDGLHLAVATHDGRVVLVRLGDSSLHTIDRSEHADASGLCFSPDSAWLAWSHAGPPPLRQVKLARVGAGDAEVVEATPLRFVDHDPVFSLDGKFLAFLSARTFDPVYDEHVFDLSFQAGSRPYLVPLAASTPSPFGPELAGRARTGPAGGETEEEEDAVRSSGAASNETGGGGAETGQRQAGQAATRQAAVSEEAAAGPVPAGQAPAGQAPAGQAATRQAAVSEEAAAGPVPAGQGGAGGAKTGKVRVVVDSEGIGERIVPLPVPAGRYSHLRAARDGLLWLAEPSLGVLGEGRAGETAEPERPRLERYDLAKRRTVELVPALDAFEVSGDGASVVVRDRERLRVLPAERAVEAADAEESDEVIEVDTTRLRVELDPAREWRQMYEEAARLMRDHYWVADMAGVDWDAVVERYRPLLDAIATRDDLSELIWEVQAELGTSHAYEDPPQRPVEAELRLGMLGADLRRDDDGSWRIDSVLPGETSVLAARSPLAAAGVALRPGDAIVAVDGHRIGPLGPAAMLAGAARKPVELTVRPASGGEERSVVVVPLGDERPLRYHAWVAGRRAAAHELSGGRVGYLHIPDMVAHGWAELHRDLHLEVARDALVVDVRNNGGGHVSELVLEKLARTVTAWIVGRHHSAEPYPTDAPRGPRVLLTDEVAGSDGDIVTAGFRQRGIGPIVGRRTWGGVIGIDGRYVLVDGTSVTQPRYAFWFTGGLGWSVENHGVEPDIDVPTAPQDWGAGRDPQLERAVTVALELLEQHPPARPPDPSTRPSRAAPPLPPRP